MKGSKVKRTMIEVDGLRLFCRDTGSNKQPILCLHGKWGRGETWTDFIFRLQDRYRIIAPDQRGHGLSDKPIARYAAEDFSADAHGLIQRLGCGPVIAVGHSLGGRNAAYLAALHPQEVKALAILDQQAEDPGSLSDLPPEKVPPVDKLTADWPTPYSTYEEAVGDLSQRFERETNVRYFLDSLVETEEGYDFLFSPYAMSAIDVYRQVWYHILPQIQCPVLFVRAQDSWCLSAEEANKMRGMIKDCTYFEVSDSNHMVYADNPGEFYPQFEKFLESI
jgi:2-succinyl-6-hydroxy-2,4-cyclohexadiene-1-carboxylate synthase